MGTSEQWLKNPWNRLVVYHNPDESPRLETPGVLEEYGWVIDDDNPLVPIKKLKPDTWYVYAIELYYNPPDAEEIYIRPLRIEKCKTAKPNVVHSGWSHIMAVGKKTNGLQGDKWIPEKLVYQDGPLKNSNNEFDDTIKDPYYYLAEDSSIDEGGMSVVTGERRVTEGIAHLSWFDFKVSMSSNYVNNLIDSENIGDSVENFYYTVERSETTDFIESEDLPGKVFSQKRNIPIPLCRLFDP